MKGIDDVRIYDRALSQTNIAELYAIPNSYAVPKPMQVTVKP